MAPDYLTRAELFAQGLTRSLIVEALRAGRLVHVRRDRYLLPGADDAFVRAVRVGGRLTCLSYLGMLEVFVLENHDLHVHVRPTASRLRSPRDRRKRISPARRRGVRLHWTDLMDDCGQASATGLVDALALAVRCQQPTSAIATLDSALNKGLIADADLARIFKALPTRFRVLEAFLDRRAESGPETLVRLMARRLGCDIRLQVEFVEIGRVDLLLDGWLVVECDGKPFHEEWSAQLRDHRRDMALAARGYATLRLPASDIMYRPDEVFAALRGLIESRRA